MSPGRPRRRFTGLVLPPALLALGLGCSARGVAPVHVPGDGLRASCKGRLTLGEEAVRFRCSLALLAPDRIRVEMRGPIGGTRALFALHRGRILALLPGTREYIQERASAGSVAALLGVKVDSRGLFNLISSADPRRCGEVESMPGLTLGCRDGILNAVFEGGTLELQLKEIERGVSIPDELFSLEAPAGWTRLVLDDGPMPGFLLRQ